MERGSETVSVYFYLSSIFATILLHAFISVTT